jgi:hypothetical protein
MIKILNSWPDWLIILLFSIACLVVMYSLHAILRPILNKLIPGEERELSISIHSTMVSALAAIIAFSMVQALTNFQKEDAIVSVEATQINNLDRLLTRYGDHKFDVIRADLLSYAESIVKDEWPTLYEGHGSDKTQKLFFPVAKAAVAIRPSSGREEILYGEIVKLTESIAESRDSRIEIAHIQIPYIYWLAIAILFVAKTLLSSAYKPSREESFSLGVQMVVLASLLAIVFIFDQPFLGETAIQPDAIVDAITLMKARQM